VSGQALDGRRILVMVYGHLADTIAAIPGLRTLRRAYPGARIEVLVLESAAPILAGSPYIDELITWSDLKRKGGRLARAEKALTLTAVALRLRRRGYDLAIVFHRSFGFMKRLAAAVGAPVVVYAAARETPESSRDENRRVLDGLGLEEDGMPVELWTSPADDSRARAMLPSSRSRPLIGLHPGSDWSCQQWLPSAFAAVARRAQLTFGADIVITGSTGDRSLQEEIAESLHDAPVRLAGQTTIGELIAVVRRLDLLICVNSSAAAIARAVDTPAVVLLGPEDARYTGLEQTDRVRVVQAASHSVPGSWCEFGRWGVLSSCESPMCRGIGGLGDVSPDRVFREVIRVLGSAPTTIDSARRFAQEVAT